MRLNQPRPLAGYALLAAAGMLAGRQSVVIVFRSLKVLLDQRKGLSNDV